MSNIVLIKYNSLKINSPVMKAEAAFIAIRSHEKTLDLL